MEGLTQKVNQHTLTKIAAEEKCHKGNNLPANNLPAGFLLLEAILEEE